MARVAYVIATLDRGGSESQLVHLATGLDRSRFQPTVIALTRGGPLESALAGTGISTFILQKRRKLDLLAFRRLRELLRLLRPDIVHTWLFTASAYGRWAALGAGVPHLLASERSTDPAKPWANRLIDRRLARRTDRIVANCQAVADVCTRRLDLPAEHVLIIPNGLELQPLPADAGDRFRTREGLSADALLFTTACRLDGSKAVDDLVRALARVAAELERAYLVVVGAGDELPRLRALAGHLRVAERVIFLGEVAEVGEVLAASDAFVFASLYEGLPNALLEAMAAGLAVVSTAVGGIPEIISERETGLLVPVRRPDELAARMLELAGDPGLRHRLGESAKRKAREFTMERMVNAYQELYEQVLAGKPRSQ